MKEALYTQFAPRDHTWNVRTKLRNLRQYSSIQAYNHEYLGLMVEITDMFDRDGLFNFMMGMYPWA